MTLHLVHPAPPRAAPVVDDAEDREHVALRAAWAVDKLLGVLAQQAAAIGQTDPAAFVAITVDAVRRLELLNGAAMAALSDDVATIEELRTLLDNGCARAD